ncbi:MAG: hypothetical protein K2Q18_18805 [Bdellovibrionales bacterium]|nr:hypothetical protein [Bdellovibrionales bacterium]
MKLIKFLLPICLMLNTAFAGVAGILVNNVSSGGQACGLISYEDYRSFVKSRQLENYHQDLLGKRMNPLEAFQRLIYLKSIDQFEKKATCKKDYSNEVIHSDQAINEVFQSMMLVWLNKKKSELYLRHCQRVNIALSEMHSYRSNNNSSSIADKEKMDFEYLKSRGDLYVKYFDICKNEDTIKALKGLVKVSARSLPVLSSQELLNIMEEERNVIVFKKTGKPITNVELMELDLTGSKLLTTNKQIVSQVKEKIKNYFSTRIQVDEDRISELKERDFSRNQLEKLYNEGIVQEVTDSLNLSSKNIDDNTKRLHQCFNNLYEPSIVGDLVDMIVSFTLTKKILSNIPKFSALPVLAQDGASGLIATLPTLVNKCVLKKSEVYKTSGQVKDQKISFHKSDLPSTVDVDLYNLESVQISSIPSCKEINMERLYFESINDISCVQESLSSILPLKMGIGYSLTLFFYEQNR